MQCHFFPEEIATARYKTLVSHYSAIGDTISRDAPYSTIGFRDKLCLRYPLVGSVFGPR